ncbi:hypothetical protein JW752_02155 [Candidatus Peregrinibacteria bacterium]|nr:hypothetical protein [Candidatus Peregrinibacteria bacterium]
MSDLSKKPSSAPSLDFTKGLDVMKKGLDKSISMLTKLWGKFSEMVGGLNKKYLAPLMAPLTGWLDNFADLKLPGLDEKKDKDKKGKEKTPPEKRPEKPETKVKLDELMGEIEIGERPRFDPAKIQSHPVEVDRNGTTLCSLTAKKNLEMLCPGKIFQSISPDHTKRDIQRVREGAAAGKFDLKDVIPTGNADDVQQYYYSLRKNDTISGVLPKDFTDQLNATGKTVCDIITYGGTKYDHRAAGFKGTDGQWYVLDPYRSGRNTNPISFEDYIKKNKTDIAFVVPIDTAGQTLKGREVLAGPQRILKAVDEFIEKKIVGKNCWDWVDKVYRRAGFSPKKRLIIYNSDTTKYEGSDCKDEHAGPELLARLSPGDHLYINNKNAQDAYGNHSVIFLGWADRDNLIARTASSPGNGTHGRIWSSTDFKKMPVTHITKPA